MASAPFPGWRSACGPRAVYSLGRGLPKPLPSADGLRALLSATLSRVAFRVWPQGCLFIGERTPQTPPVGRWPPKNRAFFSGCNHCLKARVAQVGCLSGAGAIFSWRPAPPRSDKFLIFNLLIIQHGAGPGYFSAPAPRRATKKAFRGTGRCFTSMSRDGKGLPWNGTLFSLPPCYQKGHSVHGKLFLIHAVSCNILIDKS